MSNEMSIHWMQQKHLSFLVKAQPDEEFLGIPAGLFFLLSAAG